MNGFFYVFIVCLILLILAFLVTQITIESHHNDDKDTDFLDEEGDHKYYDRSIIEKKNFSRRHPEISDDEVRSLRRLFNFFRGNEEKR